MKLIALCGAFRAEDPPGFFTMTTIRCADFNERYRAAMSAAPRPPAAQEREPLSIGQIEEFVRQADIKIDSSDDLEAVIYLTRASN